MKVLLDESLPRRLKKDFTGHFVKTVPDMNWQGKKNGELLKLMESRFDVFVTADRNLQYQINLRNASMSIIVIEAPTNRYRDIAKLIPKIVRKLTPKLRKGIIRI